MDASGDARTLDVKHIQDLFSALRSRGITEVTVFRQALDISSDANVRMSERAHVALGKFLHDVASTDTDVRVAVRYAERLRASEAYVVRKIATEPARQPAQGQTRVNGEVVRGAQDTHPIFNTPLFPT
jgi:hypothetical protein